MEGASCKVNEYRYNRKDEAYLFVRIQRVEKDIECRDSNEPRELMHFPYSLEVFSPSS